MNDTETLAIPTHVKPGLDVKATRNAQAIAYLEAFEVVDVATLAEANELVRIVKADWNAAEVERTAVTKPLNEILRRVNGWFRPVQDPLKQAEQILKSKIAAYTLAQRAEQERTMHAAAEALAQGNQAQASAHVAALAPVAMPAGTSVKARWAFRVVDPDKVPRQFCSPDVDKIKAALPREVHPSRTPQIEGVEFYVDGQVTVR